MSMISRYIFGTPLPTMAVVREIAPSGGEIPHFTVTKADADLAMANTMAQLLAAGKTADEAQGIIDRAVGTTDAERIDYIRKASEAPLCLGSEGTMNGGTLSTEQEIAIGVEAVKRLDALIV